MDEDDRYARITLRIPKDLHDKLSAAGKSTSKSMNAEIVGRLEESFQVHGAHTYAPYVVRSLGYAVITREICEYIIRELNVSSKDDQAFINDTLDKAKIDVSTYAKDAVDAATLLVKLGMGTSQSTSSAKILADPLDVPAAVRRGVVSSTLSQADYDTETQELHIWFMPGTRPYTYVGVPQRLYDGLLAAPSKGRYFDNYIKDAYPVRK